MNAKESAIRRVKAQIFEDLTPAEKEKALLCAGVGRGTANQVAHNGGPAVFDCGLYNQVKFSKFSVWEHVPEIQKKVAFAAMMTGLSEEMVVSLLTQAGVPDAEAARMNRDMPLDEMKQVFEKAPREIWACVPEDWQSHAALAFP